MIHIRLALILLAVFFSSVAFSQTCNVGCRCGRTCISCEDTCRVDDNDSSSSAVNPEDAGKFDVGYCLLAGGVITALVAVPIGIYAWLTSVSEGMQIEANKRAKKRNSESGGRPDANGGMKRTESEESGVSVEVVDVKDHQRDSKEADTSRKREEKIKKEWNSRGQWSDASGFSECFSWNDDGNLIRNEEKCPSKTKCETPECREIEEAMSENGLPEQ
jgi:hypothetical protein